MNICLILLETTHQLKIRLRTATFLTFSNQEYVKFQFCMHTLKQIPKLAEQPRTGFSKYHTLQICANFSSYYFSWQPRSNTILISQLPCFLCHYRFTILKISKANTVYIHAATMTATSRDHQFWSHRMRDTFDQKQSRLFTLHLLHDRKIGLITRECRGHVSMNRISYMGMLSILFEAYASYLFAQREAIDLHAFFESMVLE